LLLEDQTGCNALGIVAESTTSTSLRVHIKNSSITIEEGRLFAFSLSSWENQVDLTLELAHVCTSKRAKIEYALQANDDDFDRDSSKSRGMVLLYIESIAEANIRGLDEQKTKRGIL
jgi:hypothetical protein